MASTNTSTMSFKSTPAPRDFLPMMRESVKETMRTHKESGFSIGIAQNSDGTCIANLHQGVDSATLPYGQMIPRPPSGEHPLIHFHTHVPDDNARGLSIMDVLFAAFQESTYDYFVVANTALNEINVYQSFKVLGDSDYNRVIETEKKLATDAALSMFRQRGKAPEEEYLSLLNQNKVSQAISWLKSHGYVQASKILEQYFREWNSFMNKTRTTVYPIKES